MLSRPGWRTLFRKWATCDSQNWVCKSHRVSHAIQPAVDNKRSRNWRRYQGPHLVWQKGPLYHSCPLRWTLLFHRQTEGCDRKACRIPAEILRTAIHGSWSRKREAVEETGIGQWVFIGPHIHAYQCIKVKNEEIGIQDQTLNTFTREQKETQLKDVEDSIGQQVDESAIIHWSQETHCHPNFNRKRQHGIRIHVFNGEWFGDCWWGLSRQWWTFILSFELYTVLYLLSGWSWTVIF